MIAHLLSYRRYILRAAIYDIRFRYAGMSLGVFWYLVNPALTIALYTVVFSAIIVVNRDLIGGAPFALFLCLGVVPWLSFTESLLHSSEAITANRLYLRRLPIPAEIFVARSSLSSATGAAVSIALILLVSIASGFFPTALWLLLPLIALLFQTLAFGLAVGLAAVRVLVRDVGELIRAVMQLWTWTLPIVYPEQLVPEQFRAYLLLNPPYAYIRSIRSVVLENTMPEPHFIIAMIGWPAVALFCSSIVMGRLRSQIKDAL